MAGCSVSVFVCACVRAVINFRILSDAGNFLSS